MRFRIRSNIRFVVIPTTNSSNAETAHLPHGNLSGTLGKEHKQELAQLGADGMRTSQQSEKGLA